LDERALGIRRAINDQLGVASSLHNLGLALRDGGDLDASVRYLEEAARLFEELGDPRMVASALGYLGQIAAQRGDLAASDAAQRRALDLSRETGDERGVAAALHDLGGNARRRGDLVGAMGYFRECLESRRRHRDQVMAAPALEAVARVARDAGQPAVAVTLYSAARRLREQTGYALDDPWEEAVALRPLLGDKAFAVALENGRHASFEEAADLALAFDPSRAPVSPPAASAPAPKPAPPDHDLTRRELDVLRLIAAGKSNAEIGEALFISPYTAKTHVANLLGKLGTETRAAAATWAARQGIV
jgi:non-specific serine/threonine protein kinase